jgi:uncharacterized protein
MPRGNVETVRRAVEALRNRDAAALRELFHKKAEFRSAIVGGKGGTTYRGHADIERYLADMDKAFEHWQAEDERYFDVGSDWVVFFHRIVGKDKESGALVEQPVGIVFSLRDRRVGRGLAYLDHLEAMKVGMQHTFEAFGHGDLDTVVGNLDPDIEWAHALGSGAPEEGLYRGRDQVRRLLERLRDSWIDIGTKPHEVVEAAKDRFIVHAVIRAKGRMSDIELESGCRYEIEFRDGKAVRVRFELTGPARPPEESLESSESRTA